MSRFALVFVYMFRFYPCVSLLCFTFVCFTTVCFTFVCFSSLCFTFVCFTTVCCTFISLPLVLRVFLSRFVDFVFFSWCLCLSASFLPPYFPVGFILYISKLLFIFFLCLPSTPVRSFACHLFIHPHALASLSPSHPRLLSSRLRSSFPLASSHTFPSISVPSFVSTLSFLPIYIPLLIDYLTFSLVSLSLLPVLYFVFILLSSSRPFSCICHT